MLGVSYGFEAPIIGFALKMLFESPAFLIAAIAVNKMKEAKKDNELFYSADISAVNRYDKTLGISVLRLELSPKVSYIFLLNGSCDETQILYQCYYIIVSQ